MPKRTTVRTDADVSLNVPSVRPSVGCGVSPPDEEAPPMWAFHLPIGIPHRQRDECKGVENSMLRRRMWSLPFQHRRVEQRVKHFQLPEEGISRQVSRAQWREFMEKKSPASGGRRT